MTYFIVHFFACNRKLIEWEPAGEDGLTVNPTLTKTFDGKNEKIALEDINSFVQISFNSHLCSPTEISPTVIRNMSMITDNRKLPQITILKYSCNVNSSKQFAQVKKILIDPHEKDRSKAATNAAVFQTAKRLRQLHPELSGNDLAFLSWASNIHSQPACDHDELIHQPPHHSFANQFTVVHIRDFDTVTTNKASRLAGQMNEAMKEEVTALCASVKQLSQQVSFVQKQADRLDARIKGQQETIKLFHDMVPPQEYKETRSLEFLANVQAQNIDDTEHMLPSHNQPSQSKKTTATTSHSTAGAWTRRSSSSSNSNNTSLSPVEIISNSRKKEKDGYQWLFLIK